MSERNEVEFFVPRRTVPSPMVSGKLSRVTSQETDFDPDWILERPEGLVVIDKPAGIPVHYGTDHPRGVAEMLEEWILANPGTLHLSEGRHVSPLHRLDLEASGVLLLGLEHGRSAAVQQAFAEGLVRKRYLAVVAGPVKLEGAIKGKVRTRLRGVYRWLPSRLTYRRLAGDERLSLVEVVPEGGRTHQIRSLFASAGRPLAGDLRFGKPKPSRQFLEKFGLEHLLLHCRELTLPPGPLGAERTFRAPVPAAFRAVAEKKGWALETIAQG